ncbi:MAG: lipase [Myxococcaceae bacterium]|nr:lipase [Myxococcaceae bacterium]
MTTLLLYIAFLTTVITLLVLMVWAAHIWFWRRRLSVPLDYAAVEKLVMPDGAVIELRRLDATSTLGPKGERSPVPVLLLHGLAMNHRNHDAAEQSSFARHLRNHGRDVWLLTVRSGFSPLSVFGHPKADFASMVKYDVPHAVATVLARTGQRQLDVAGFSMGGMLLYATLDRTVDSRQIRRAAVFAGPAKIRPLGILNLSRVLPRGFSPSVPMRLLTHTFAFAPRLVPSFLWRRLYNPANTDPKVERGMLVNVWEDIPGRLGADFVRWSSRGGEIEVDGVPILPGLAKVSVPVCFFAGSVDWLAPVETVRAGYEAWGRGLPSVDKHFLVLGRASGNCDDYGHCDISFGRNVTKEVFEPASQFLASGVFQVPRTAHVEALSEEFADADASPAH